VNDPNVFAFIRRSGDETVLVTLNMSSSQHIVSYDLADGSSKGAALEPLYSSTEAAASIPLDHVVLAPFAALVARVK
jgi:hypothetical protein